MSLSGERRVAGRNQEQLGMRLVRIVIRCRCMCAMYAAFVFSGHALRLLQTSPGAQMGLPGIMLMEEKGKTLNTTWLTL